MIQQSTYNAGKSFQKQKGGKSLHNDQYIFYLIDKEEMKKYELVTWNITFIISLEE